MTGPEVTERLRAILRDVEVLVLANREHAPALAVHLIGYSVGAAYALGLDVRELVSSALRTAKASAAARGGS